MQITLRETDTTPPLVQATEWLLLSASITGSILFGALMLWH